MERCYHKKENNVLMVGTTADGGAIYCNAYDSKTKTFCKKMKNACALHAVKRHASANGNDGPVGFLATGLLNGNGVARRSSPQTCGCPTGDFQSGYPYSNYPSFAPGDNLLQSRYCELTRKACVKHHNWEELMRDSISNQRTQHV
jgi:hypothetical protein